MAFGSSFHFHVAYYQLPAIIFDQFLQNKQ